MSAQSYQNLKRQVVELVAVNEALSEKLAAFVADHEATVEGFMTAAVEQGEQLAEQIKLKQYHKERYDEAFKLYCEETKRAKRYEEERDNFHMQMDVDRRMRATAERERDLARGAAAVMRSQAFPSGPVFPWDGPQSLEELQDFDPVTRLRRR